MRYSTGTAVKLRATADLTIVTGLAASYVWLWRGSFAYDKLVLTAALVAWSIVFHAWRGDAWRRLLGRRADFATASRLVFACVVVSFLSIVVYGFFEPPSALPAASEIGGRLVAFIALGLLQQYLLLAHLLSSARDLWATESVAILTSAVLFAMLHLPNPFMVGVTLVAAVVACMIYRRAPNIFAIGLGHGCVSLALYYGLSRSLTHGLRIGPAFP